MDGIECDGWNGWDRMRWMEWNAMDGMRWNEMDGENMGWNVME